MSKPNSAEFSWLVLWLKSCEQEPLLRTTYFRNSVFNSSLWIFSFWGSVSRPIPYSYVYCAQIEPCTRQLDYFVATNMREWLQLCITVNYLTQPRERTHTTTNIEEARIEYMLCISPKACVEQRRICPRFFTQNNSIFYADIVEQFVVF